MSRELYLCVHAAEFPAQALLRLRAELKGAPVAVLDGRAPVEEVCSLNARARALGAVRGMTRVEAEAVAGLRLLPRSVENEASARAALLECAANFSPRIEDASSAMAATCVLDIAGTERLFGPPRALADRIRSALAAAGFRATIAVSRNYHTACMKAAWTRGISVIEAGEDANAVAALPVEALGLSCDQAETFQSWGIRTLGELAVLDETDLVVRLGPLAAGWRQLALGIHGHTFRPIEPEFKLAEVCEFETPVEQIESLLFTASRMIDCLVERAAGRALCVASLNVELKLENGGVHRCAIRPALPTIDRKFLLKLVQLEIGAHPPESAVTALALAAEAGQSSKVQLGLFAPQTPEPSRLDVTLARLKALVGEDRAGSPMLDDTHRPGSFHMEEFTVEAKTAASRDGQPRLALRRARPPIPVRVVLRAMRPVAFRDAQNRYEVQAAYGPWRSSGCWWSVDGWDTEEWDVLASDGSGASSACLLVSNRARDEWRLEAFYD